MHSGKCIRSKTMIWLAGISDPQRHVTIQVTRCKMWDCEHCAIINVMQHRERMKYGYSKIKDAGRQLGFLTLTMPSHITTPDAGIERWRQTWNKLSQRARRRHKRMGTLYAYCYIPEISAAGRFHIHGFFSDGCDTRWWKDNAAMSGWGHQAELSEIWHVGVVSKYLTKYVSKSLSNSAFPKGLRRVNYSRSWPKLPKPVSEWVWMPLDKKTSLSEYIKDFNDAGYSVDIEHEYANW